MHIEKRVKIYLGAGYTAAQVHVPVGRLEPNQKNLCYIIF
jgi:hypothetical protein